LTNECSMSVIDAKMIDEKVDVTAEETTVTEVWRCTTDTPLDNSFTIGASPLIPHMFMANASHPAARVAQISIDKVSGQFTHYDATIKYSSRVDENGENPLAVSPQVQLSGEQRQVATLYDINGQAIVNSANDPPDPPIMRDDTPPVVTVTENRATYDFAAQQAYQDAVNSDVWSISAPGLTFGSIKPGVAKIKTFQGDGPHETNGITYWKRTITVIFQRDGWKTKRLDQGKRYITTEYAGHPTKQIIDVNALAGTFAVNGDVTGAVQAGDLFAVEGSPDWDGDGIADNDGEYVVVSATFVNGNTIIATLTPFATDAVGGYAMFNPSPEPVKKDIRTSDGESVKDAVLLDGAGYPMDVNYQSFQPTPSDAVFLEDTLYFEMPFRFLGFV
jgi:hypothetical protein